MANNKPLKTREAPFRKIQVRHPNAGCRSTRNEVPVVKTSIPELKFFPDNKRQNYTIRDSSEYYIRMDSLVLLHEPYYVRAIFSLFFFHDLDNENAMLDFLAYDYKAALSINSARGNFLRILIFQLIIYLACLIQKNKDLSKTDSFFFAPNFLQLEEEDNLEPEPFNFITNMAQNNYFSNENAKLLLMKRLIIGFNSSKSDEELIEWNGKIEELETWFIGCFYRKLLTILDRIFKSHTGKNKGRKSNDEYEGEYSDSTDNYDSPIFSMLLKNHFKIPCKYSYNNLNPMSTHFSTYFRHFILINNYFSRIRDIDINKFDKSSKTEFIDIITTPPDKIFKNLRKKYCKNILSACKCIPERICL